MNEEEFKKYLERTIEDEIDSQLYDNAEIPPTQIETCAMDWIMSSMCNCGVSVRNHTILDAVDCAELDMENFMKEMVEK